MTWSLSSFIDLDFCLQSVHFLVVHCHLLILNCLSFTILTLLCFHFFQFDTASDLVGGGWGGFHITHGPCNTSIWVNSFSFMFVHFLLSFMFIHILLRGLGFWFRGDGNHVWHKTDFPRYTSTNSAAETLPLNVDHTPLFVTTMVAMLAIQAIMCRASSLPLFPGCLIYS